MKKNNNLTELLSSALNEGWEIYEVDGEKLYYPGRHKFGSMVCYKTITLKKEGERKKFILDFAYGNTVRPGSPA